MALTEENDIFENNELDTETDIDTDADASSESESVIETKVMSATTQLMAEINEENQNTRKTKRGNPKEVERRRELEERLEQKRLRELYGDEII